MDNEEIPKYRKKKRKTKWAIEEKYFDPDFVEPKEEKGLVTNFYIHRNHDYRIMSSYVKLGDAEKALKSMEKKCKLPLWSRVYRHYSYRIVKK